MPITLLKSANYCYRSYEYGFEFIYCSFFIELLNQRVPIYFRMLSQRSFPIINRRFDQLSLLFSALLANIGHPYCSFLVALPRHFYPTETFSSSPAMFPNPLTSAATSEKRAAPDPNDANVQSNALILHPSSTNNNSAQEPESSNSSAPPPYVRNTPLDNPFRDGEAPAGDFYLNGNSVPKGIQSTTASHHDASLADPLPPVPSANDDPFAVDLVLNESLLSRPPLLAQSSGLRRGLHIPSRASHITWGFSFPEILAEQGVTKTQWKSFMHEVKAFASMSIGQWAACLACSSGLGIVFGYFAIPPGQSPKCGLVLIHFV